MFAALIVSKFWRHMPECGYSFQLRKPLFLIHHQLVLRSFRPPFG